MNRTTIVRAAVYGVLAVVFVLALVVLTTNPSHGATSVPRGPKHPCATDEYTPEAGPCVWDARHMGNGRGHSFIITRDGRLVYVSHARAHALIVADAR